MVKKSHTNNAKYKNGKLFYFIPSKDFNNFYNFKIILLN